jgi:TonB-dependent receptor
MGQFARRLRRPRRRASANPFCALAAVGILWAACPVPGHAAEPTEKAFDLPADVLEKSLKLFSGQSGLQVLFPTDAVAGVRTQPVRGAMTSRQALDRMLAGTGFTAVQDPKSGALTVKKYSDPNGAKPNPKAPDQKKNVAMTNDTESVKAKKTVSRLGPWLAWLGLAMAPAHPLVSAEETSGTVSGRVSNQATGYFLAGASVSVEGTNIATVTEHGGNYRLSVPAGLQTLRVSYTGLDTARVAVEVSPGQTINYDFPLISNVYTLEKFTVYGEREGSARALQLQRLAPNAKTVISADTFGNPAANPGNIIQRMPGISTEIAGSEVRTIFIRGMGPEFTSLMVDGNDMANAGGIAASRNYQIDQLGTAQIESIELVKAPTPDMDANAVAGFINLISKRAFDLPGRRVSLTLGTSWIDRGFDGSPFKKRPDGLDLIAFSYSDVFGVLGRQKNLGITLNLARRITWTLQDELGTRLNSPAGSYNVTNPADPLMRDWGTGETAFDTVANNTGLNVDYKLSNDANVYVRTTANRNDQYQTSYRFHVFTPSNRANFTPDSTYEFQQARPISNSIAEISTTSAVKKGQSYSVSAGAESRLFGGAGMLTFNTSLSYADINYPGFSGATARVSGIGWELDRRGRDPWYPEFRQTAGPSLSEAASYTPLRNNTDVYSAPNRKTSAKIDYRHNFLTPVPAYIKVGVKSVLDERSQIALRRYFTWAGPDGRLASGDEGNIVPYAGPTYRQGHGRYGPWPFLSSPGTARPEDIQSVPEQYWIKSASDAYNDAVSLLGGTHEFSEKISAGYVYGNMKLGKLRILGGLRFEQTDTKGTSNLRSITSENSLSASRSIEENVARATASFVGKTTLTGKYRSVFPGIHFVYEPGRDFVFRASYNNSISRPPISNLVPRTSVNRDSLTVTQGNPSLKPYTSDNFELSAEKYFEPVGTFTAGVFLKEITNYIRTVDIPITEGEYTGYTLRQSANTGNARIRGFELAYQQQFRFLPGFFRGFGFFANYSYTSALGSFGGTNFQARLPRLTPRSANAGLSYAGYGWDVRLLSNYKADTYTGGAGSTSAYVESRLMWDLKMQYVINRRVQLYLDVINLTNEPTSATYLEGRRPAVKSFKGASYFAGVKTRF